MTVHIGCLFVLSNTGNCRFLRKEALKVQPVHLHHCQTKLQTYYQPVHYRHNYLMMVVYNLLLRLQFVITAEQLWRAGAEGVDHIEEHLNLIDDNARAGMTIEGREHILNACYISGNLVWRCQL